MTTKQFALTSTVEAGLLCKDGAGNFIISTEYMDYQRYSGLIKTFESKEDAAAFIESTGFYALQPKEIDENFNIKN